MTTNTPYSQTSEWILGPRNDSGGPQYRAASHEAMSTVAIEPPTDRYGGRGGAQYGQGQGRSDGCSTGLEVDGHRRQYRGEGVVQHAVADGLGYRECPEKSFADHSRLATTSSRSGGQQGRRGHSS